MCGIDTTDQAKSSEKAAGTLQHMELLQDTVTKKLMRNTFCSSQVVRDTVQRPKIKHHLKNTSDSGLKFQYAEETFI